MTESATIPDAELIETAHSAIEVCRDVCIAIRKEGDGDVYELDEDDLQSAHVRKLLRRKDKIEKRALAMRATTIAGMRAKAEMLMHNYYMGPSVPASPDDVDACFLASIVADLIGKARVDERNYELH
jgi:hypothetical protein